MRVEGRTMAQGNGDRPNAELTTIASALTQIARCLGVLVTQTDMMSAKPKTDVIPVLSSLGFDRNDIASILQTTPGTVSVTLSQLKAKSQTSDSKSRKKRPQRDGKQQEVPK